MNIQVEKIELIKRLADVNNKKTIEKIKAILMPKNGMDETERILANPRMIKKIKDARKEIKEGKGLKVDAQDLWK